MIKVKTTADTYKSVVLRRAIIICWLLLFVCFALKIFGGNYFEIVVNSPNFVAFCEYLDSNIILYGLIGLISSLISFGLFYLAILRKIWFNKKQSIIFFVSTVAFCIIRVFTDKLGIFDYINIIINIIQCFVMPFALNFEISKGYILRVALGNILNFLFQLVAVITKSIGLKIITESSLISIIFMIDLYIMLSLYYLYANVKRKE